MRETHTYSYMYIDNIYTYTYIHSCTEIHRHQTLCRLVFTFPLYRHKYVCVLLLLYMFACVCEQSSASLERQICFMNWRLLAATLIARRNALTVARLHRLLFHHSLQSLYVCIYPYMCICVEVVAAT